MTRKDEVGVDLQPYTESVTQASDTNDLETILQRLDAEMEVTTEDGDVGVLRLDHTSVKVTVDGYGTKTKTLTATRSYPNLSEADVSLLPKTIEDSSKTLTLGDVKWSESTDVDGEGNPVTRYTATASYTGTATSRYATGYTVTANYIGEVSKTECNVVIYTAIFGSEKIAEEPKAPDSDSDEQDAGEHADGTDTPDVPDDQDTTDPPDTSDTGDAPDTVRESVDLSGLKRPLIIGAVVLALAGGGVFVFKKIKERRG